MSEMTKLSVDRRTGDVKVSSPLLASHQPWSETQRFISRLLAADCVESVLIDRRHQTATIRMTPTGARPAQDRPNDVAGPVASSDALRQLARHLREETADPVNVSEEYAPVDSLLLSKTSEGLTAGTIVHSLPGRVRIRHPLIRKSDVSRLQEALATIPGVRTVSVSTMTGSVLILFDSSNSAPQELLASLERALTLSQEQLSLLKGPPAIRWIASGVCLGLAAATTAGVTALAPVTAGALVGFNLPTMVQGVKELVTLNWRVSSLYTVIMGTTLISGQFLAAALMQAAVTCWHGWSSHRLRTIARRLQHQSQLPLFLGRSHQNLLAEGRSFPECLIGTELEIAPESVVPYDGIVVSGDGEFDEHSIRGTTFILKRGAGDPVFAGSILRSGSVQMRITAVEKGTRVARIHETLLASMAELPGTGTPTERGHANASRFVPLTFATGTAALLLGDISTLAAVLRPDFATGPSISERFGTLSSIGHLLDSGWLVRNPDILHDLAQTESIAVIRSERSEGESKSSTTPQIRKRMIHLEGRQLSVYEVVGPEEACLDFVDKLRESGRLAVVAHGHFLNRLHDDIVRISLTPEEDLANQTADLVSLRGDVTQVEDLWQVLIDARRPHHHGWAAVVACNALAISGAFLAGLTSLHVVVITNLGALAAGMLYDRHLKRSSQILSVPSRVSDGITRTAPLVNFMNPSRVDIATAAKPARAKAKAGSSRSKASTGAMKTKMDRQKAKENRNRRGRRKDERSSDPKRATNSRQS